MARRPTSRNYHWRGPKVTAHEGQVKMVAIEVFISYRRDTDAARATLVAKFIEGAAKAGGLLSREQRIELNVYMDVADRLGVEWPKRIQEQLEKADLVIAVMGPDWLSAKD